MEKKFVPENHFPIDGKNVIIRKRMKEIRTNAGKTQAQVAEMMHIDRSVYAKYETGVLTPSEERIQQFAEIFSIRPEELEKAISAVIPDTSALMKNKRLLTTLLEDFEQVIIPDTVLSELDYRKDHSKDRKDRNAAWQVMMTIDEYRSRFRNRMLFENSERNTIVGYIHKNNIVSFVGIGFNSKTAMNAIFAELRTKVEYVGRSYYPLKVPRIEYPTYKYDGYFFQKFESEQGSMVIISKSVEMAD